MIREAGDWCLLLTRASPADLYGSLKMWARPYTVLSPFWESRTARSVRDNRAAGSQTRDDATPCQRRFYVQLIETKDFAQKFLLSS